MHGKDKNGTEYLELYCVSLTFAKLYAFYKNILCGDTKAVSQEYSETQI